jgi:hypothetical protein
MIKRSYPWCLFLMAFVVSAGASIVKPPQTLKAKGDSSAAAIREFQTRVAQFVKLHRQMAATLPPLKQTAVSKEITDHQRELARKIAEARKPAKPGDIFTAEVIAEFQRLLAVAFHGANGADIRTSLAHSEPVNREVGVNTPYPADAPLQSSPPSLLRALPKLPPELDYRIVGNALILRDVTANLVIDFMPGAIPAAEGE